MRYMKMANLTFYCLVIGHLVLLPLAANSTPTHPATKQPATHSQDPEHESPLSKKDPEIQMRNWMIEVSRQLGVTCTHCHDVKNYKSNQMKTWKISKTHIEVVDMLNKKYPHQIGNKVDCFMCHRGKAVPDYKEVLGLSQPATPSDGHSKSH